jgi:hypothetical protein
VKRRLPQVWQYHQREVYQIRLARWFADLKGYYIDGGSWIHAPSGKPVAQGWVAFYLKYRPAIVELVWGEDCK